jgi:hypothetical protein
VTPEKPPLEPVKFIVAVLAPNRKAWEEARHLLSEHLGPEEGVLEPLPFHWTRFYEKEMGADLLRSISIFQPLRNREDLPAVKNWTGELEQGLASQGARTVNLDPGYISQGQLFLASTKDGRQRVYVSEGIYVEPTLYFEGKSWHPFEWTYPDYRSGVCWELLGEGRKSLNRQIKSQELRKPWFHP